MSKRDNKERGNQGENKAFDYLKSKGYSIIARNWRSRYGEIDIIAFKNNTLVFVEVKTLPNASIDMLQKVLNTEKQKRILKTSKCFLLNNRQYSNCYIRYDVCIMDMPGLPNVYHIENAFLEN